MSSRSAKPLLVLALGGHGISPPHDVSYASERTRIAALKPMLGELADTYRLLVVHGNGPQVGRLLAADQDIGDLDIHTAQTQGELGYLLSQALPAPCVAVATRVVVHGEIGAPVKPIGPVLPTEPPMACRRVGEGWRLLVPSPRPDSVIEQEAIASLLATHHVIAGGGGGVPVTVDGSPLEAVIDKDWVASLLARSLEAQGLVLATDVAGVYSSMDPPNPTVVARMSVEAGRELLAQGLEAGSMAPKVESAVEFAGVTGRRAVICAVESVVDALQGDAGTQVTPR